MIRAKSPDPTSAPEVTVREETGVRNPNRNERSRGRSLFHGQDMGKTQNHRSGIELVGGWWRLVAVGGGWWRLVAVGGGWRFAVGGPWGLYLRTIPDQKGLGFLRTALLSTTRRQNRLLPKTLDEALMNGRIGACEDRILVWWWHTSENENVLLGAARPPGTGLRRFPCRVAPPTERRGHSGGVPSGPPCLPGL